mmetsp:Transcript_24137/g.34595  ORF Transcript_24137/g.34595 Transcript_24137/m.34595 type:complete len:210 (+) Transcript_24137:4617-5246(+)
MVAGVDAPLETEGDEPYYLQLAQDTLESDSGTDTGDQAEEHFDFTAWIAGLGGFTPPSTASAVTSSSSEEYSSATASTTRPVLEILPTPESSAHSSSEESEDSEIYIRRSLPIQPPQGELQEGDSGSYLGEANTGEHSSETSGRWSGIAFEGNTVASTVSYMSEVEVMMLGHGTPQVEGYLLEIPVRELDDPPDGNVEEAASLGDNEIE